MTYSRSKNDPRCTYKGVRGYLSVAIREGVVVEVKDTSLKLEFEDDTCGFPRTENFCIPPYYASMYTGFYSAGDVVEVEYYPYISPFDLEEYSLDQSVLPRIIQKAPKA